MTTLLLDTNVLIRFVIGEPLEQAKETAALFAAAEAGKVRLTLLPMVLAESVFVLNGFYQHSRDRVAEVLSHLIASPGFHSPEQDRLLHALKLFGSTKLDFVDCYLAAASIREGKVVISFDKDFDKLGGVMRKRPRDF